MIKLWIPIALALLLLSGCAQTVAKLAVDAAYLQDAGSNLVRETHAFRQFIRAECKASLVRDIDKLKSEGDETGLRALLAANYPGLVSLEIYGQAQEDPSKILATAFGCNGPSLPE